MRGALWAACGPGLRPLLALLLVLVSLAPGARAQGEDVLQAVVGSWKVQDAYKKWLAVWRDKYLVNNNSFVPEVKDDRLPQALRGTTAKVILSGGGAAGGVVTEGMGYALMIEGLQAYNGDADGLSNGLSLLRSWIGMVYGPGEALRGGGDGRVKSATKVDTWPYGVSAVESKDKGSVAAGLATWKYPVDLCADKKHPNEGCHGSAADADQDAIFGMIYLAAKLGYPEDFVDMVIRTIVAFASADIGFPDLYRTLPDGTKIFVPKGGSDWGGVLPAEGTYKTSHVPWCYSPGYFAPGHYRLMRAFLVNNWRPEFDAYLPPHLSGKATTLDELTTAFDGAVTAGYNILYYASCSSGAVSNWVGVQTQCDDPEDLNCPGVPWAHTPYVGKKGQCSASGTTFGAYGTEASRVPWRVAMDFALYPEWATKVVIYDRQGKADYSIVFNAQTFLQRIAGQYRRLAEPVTDPVVLSKAFDPNHGAPNLTCEGVPNMGTANWWAAFISYNTFLGFLAPVTASGEENWEYQQWMDAFVGLCDFSLMEGMFCDTTYFGASQEVIVTMLMAGTVKRGGPPAPERPMAPPITGDAEVVIAQSSSGLFGKGPIGIAARLHNPFPAVAAAALFGLLAGLALLGARAAARRRHRPLPAASSGTYLELGIESSKELLKQ